jgi:hypothetical protein
MNEHHLLLGQLVDFITGRTIDDTHDERYRQKIAKILVNDKGYAKSDITPQVPLVITVEEKCWQVPVTFAVKLSGVTAMIVHYGPGSLTTRHRPALAMGRLIASHQVPVVVVTNGEEADILNGATGRVEAAGLANIPDRRELKDRLRKAPPDSMDPRRAQMEVRIVMAYEVNDRCPCDGTICTLEPPAP